ncbi:siroheme synthase CysG [Pseudooceanicola onchidii]|uniref:siroheme synthase CysG n=1 Tax=Pseudooceanicola onchidii TaxID=2562279 RepID=UPI0010AAB9D2|nr:siroheme synthase CysG [Pseudooceanicola onchidii]
MKTFPMFLKMAGRRVVLCGGGEEIARKTRLILKTEARITLLAHALDAELQALVDTGRADHVTDAAGVFDNAALVFIGTGCPAWDVALAVQARAAGAVVNVIDQPELCDAFTPSIVDRDPVVVAIGTEGQAPVLGRAIKTEVETMLSPRLGSFVALAGRLRGAVAQHIARPDRRAFWEWAFTGDAFRAHLAGRERAAASMLKAAVEAGAAPERRGHIALVGAGPGARDLLTLRAVQRLQQADIIFYDRLVDPEVLELARRDADRVYVGKAVGASAWPQERIDQLIVAEAAQGRRVVRLKSGDPSIFGRATEEITAARLAGIEVEVVPGITAASAAAATIQTPLTERGETDSFTISTGMCRPGDAAPDSATLVRPGTTTAFYMAVDKARDVQAGLIRGGAPAACPVDIVAAASTQQERHVTCMLGDLAATVQAEAIASPAVIMVRYPKSLANAARQVA